MENAWSLAEYTLDDLYEMAAIVEQGGFDFYARLIARVSDPRVKSELKFLRDEEAVHKAFFLEQLRAGGGAPRGAVAEKLQALLEKEFLEPIAGTFTRGGASDNDKALRFGAVLEQKSIDFYTALAGSVGAAQRDALARIIAQEEGHKRKLELIRAF